MDRNWKIVLSKSKRFVRWRFHLPVGERKKEHEKKKLNPAYWQTL